MAVIASGVGREDERWVLSPLPLTRRKMLDDSETEAAGLSRDEPGGYPFTAQVGSGVQAA